MSSSSLTPIPIPIPIPISTPTPTPSLEITKLKKKPFISKGVKYFGGAILFLIVCGIALFLILDKVAKDNVARLASAPAPA